MTLPSAPINLSRFKDLSQLASPTPRSGSDAQVAPPLTATLSRFVEDPHNPRTEFDTKEFKALVEDIREHGILQPVVVVPLENGQLMLRWGARRLRAARQLGLEVIPYSIQTDARQQSEFAQVSENEQRADLSPMDLARFVERMVAKGMHKKDIAAKLRKDSAVITHLLSLATAPGFILELYRSGQCRQPEYLYELRKLWETHPEAVEKHCARQEPVTATFVSKLKSLLNAAAASRRRSRQARPKRHGPNKYELTSKAVAKRPLTLETRSVTIVSCRMLIREQDGSEHELAGDALAELLLAGARPRNATVFFT
jgi:ParB/RepB/Spo0J family partition protein